MTEPGSAEAIAMVAEARATFGIQAAREMWAKLGLPGDLPVDETASVARGGQANWVSLMVRMPPALKAWLADQATKNGSSQNSEVVRCIRERMEREQAT